MNKLNIFIIIKDHFSTFTNYRTGKKDKSDYIIFLVFPFLLSSILIHKNIFLTKELSNILITALSIFAALLFNLLLLTYDIISKNKNNNENGANVKNNKLKNKFLREIYSNISFAILISIATVILLILGYFICFYYVTLILNFLVYFFTVLFLLTLFLILKRVHILISKEFA